jgi:predicted nucleic acid-binding protein
VGSPVTRVPRAYLDTNVFIAAYEHASARSDHARWVLDAVEDGRILGATSEITLAELLVKPFQEEALAIVDAYLAIIQPGPAFDVMPVGRTVLIEAARVRAGRVSIRLPDAIHVATARRLGCDCLVSDDGQLETPKGPPAIALGPYTIDDILARRP